MAAKDTQLSITIRTVDASSAKIKAINDQLDKISKPTRDFGKALGELAEKSGLNDIIGGFKGVGSAIGDLLGKVAMIGGIAGVGVAEIFHLTKQFDDLGKSATKIGVDVDFLAEMRDAAERTGVPVEALDSSLLTFSKNIGEAKAGTGRMAKFLGIVSPQLLEQVKGAKDSAAAFDLMANAMAKLPDTMRQTALAQKGFGDAALAPLLHMGAGAIAKMRQHYLDTAGSQKEAAKAAEEAGKAFADVSNATDGVKAALVVGLAPALEDIAKQLKGWLVDHRPDIQQWAIDIGKKIPDAIKTVKEWIEKAYDKVVAFVDKIGGLRNAAIGAGLILAGPLIGSIVSLSGALFTAIGRAGALAKAMSSIPAAGGAAGAGGALGLLGVVGAGVAGVELLDRATGGHSSIASFVRDAAIKKAVAEGDTDALKDAEATPEEIAAATPATAQRPAFRNAGRGLQDLKGLDATPDASAQAVGALNGANAIDPELRAALIALAAKDATQASLKVDFTNAPRGMRASADPQSKGSVDLSVGYQMFGGT